MAHSSKEYMRSYMKDYRQRKKTAATLHLAETLQSMYDRDMPEVSGKSFYADSEMLDKALNVAIKDIAETIAISVYESKAPFTDSKGMVETTLNGLLSELSLSGMDKIKLIHSIYLNAPRILEKLAGFVPQSENLDVFRERIQQFDKLLQAVEEYGRANGWGWVKGAKQ